MQHGKRPISHVLGLLAYHHRNEMQRAIAKLDLYLGQELIVVDLHQNPASTQAELVKRLGVEQPTVARALSRMQEAGFIQQLRDEHDRRTVRISLTPKGTKAVPKVLDAWIAVEAHAVNGLTLQKQSQLLQLLRAVIDNYDLTDIFGKAQAGRPSCFPAHSGHHRSIFGNRLERDPGDARSLIDASYGGYVRGPGSGISL